MTATPEPGFVFVQWQYGDLKLTTNPAEIIFAEGLTARSPGISSFARQHH